MASGSGNDIDNKRVQIEANQPLLWLQGRNLSRKYPFADLVTHVIALFKLGFPIEAGSTFKLALVRAGAEVNHVHRASLYLPTSGQTVG